MNAAHPFFAGILVLILLTLGGYFGWRQVRQLRSLGTQPDLPADDRRFLRRQAWRRLACSVLLTLLAGLLAATFLLGLEERASELAARSEAVRASGGALVLDAEQRALVHVWSLVWIAALLLLLAVLMLAGLDLWAIRRYGLRQRRQIQADRREMIEQQLARYRTQRNGHQ